MKIFYEECEEHVRSITKCPFISNLNVGSSACYNCEYITSHRDNYVTCEHPLSILPAPPARRVLSEDVRLSEPPKPPPPRNPKGVLMKDKYKDYKIVKRTNKDECTIYRLKYKMLPFTWLFIYEGMKPLERVSYTAIKRELNRIIKSKEDIKNKEVLGDWQVVKIDE